MHVNCQNDTHSEKYKDACEEAGRTSQHTCNLPVSWLAGHRSTIYPRCLLGRTLDPSDISMSRSHKSEFFRSRWTDRRSSIVSTKPPAGKSRVSGTSSTKMKGYGSASSPASVERFALGPICRVGSPLAMPFLERGLTMRRHAQSGTR